MPETIDPRILIGDCIERMRELPDNSIHAVVTDPPYGIEFMGREWDTFRAKDRETGAKHPGQTRTWTDAAGSGIGIGGPRFSTQGAADARAFQDWCGEWLAEALRVLRPGGHLLAFGGTRMFHRLACAVEDAGFEMRDMLAWLYGTGKPPSVTPKVDQGIYGARLKPAIEPIVCARKPFTGTLGANVAAWGVGHLDIDACRIGVADEAYARNCSGDRGHAGTRGDDATAATNIRSGGGTAAAGRWPANVLLSHTDGCQPVGTRPDARVVNVGFTDELQSPNYGTRRTVTETVMSTAEVWACADGCPVAELDRQSGTASASRFFYVAKPSPAEREHGLAHLTPRTVDNGRDPDSQGARNGSAGAGRSAKPRANIHPTVKPVALMRHLVRLVVPADGVLLDPFLGSGTTAVAAILEGVQWLGCERDADYLPIIAGRVAQAERDAAAARAQQTDDVVQATLFDVDPAA